jgi:hypothetical protein
MSTPSDDTPTRIGDRYRLDERIGAGAMGAVWRATDELLNRTVAVKELLAAAVPARGGALEESRQRILREGRIGARLQHPHVISMFDVVVHEDSPWLVMEYLPSQSLAQRLTADGSMPPLEVADIGRQVADGLAAAHKAGVVHRDIKPGNVLLGDDGRVKLTDFGVSRAVDDVQLTRTGLIAGTPAFLAPEVARGQDPTAKSDVFALGATMYAAVEGHPPFGLDDNAYALLHKVATGVIEPPTRAGPLTEVMLRLMATDPDERPTAAEARDLLAKVVAGDPAPGATAVLSAGGDTVKAGARSTRATKAARRPSPRPAAAPVDRPPVEGPTTTSRRRPPVWLIALVVAIVVAALVSSGLLAYFNSRGGGGDGGTAAPLTTGAPVTPVPATTAEGQPSPSPSAAAPTTTQAAPTTTATPTTAPTEAPPAGESPAAFIERYYSLLPNNPNAAIALLTNTAVSRSGGRQNYFDFYATVREISLSNVRETGPNGAAATVNFTYKDGHTEHTGYTFVTTQDGNGNTVLQTFNQS